jgi:hypothetical protein
MRMIINYIADFGFLAIFILILFIRILFPFYLAYIDIDYGCL